MTKPKKKINWREKGFILALVIVPLVNFALFWVYVNIDTIVMTFQRFSIRNNNYEWIGFDRYVSLFQDCFMGKNKAMQNMILNSFRSYIIQIVLFPLCIIAAYAFFKKIRWEKYFRVTFYLPSVISITVLVLMYRYMFHPDFGPISMLFEKIGLGGDWLSPESDRMWGLIYVFCIWSGLGSTVIMMNSAMLRIPKEIIEAGKLDGIGFWRELFNVVLPLIMPTIGVFILGIFLSPLSFGVLPMLVAGNPGVDNKFMTMGWYILSSVSGGSEVTMLDASTVGLMMSVFMVPIVVFGRLITKKFTPEVDF